ncbi:MAG: hypothetical protein IT363_02680 [Methanoregulaceae archaeon]|nr:hypothetical protein [Methanoregulaceae archaeon]
MIALVCFLSQQLAFDPDWSMHTFSRLLPVADAPGVCSVSEAGYVSIFGQDGVLVKTVPPSPGMVPLRYSAKSGIEWTYRKLTVSRGQVSLASPLTTVFMQNDSLIRVGGGLLVVTKRGIFSRSTFDNWCGIGVNAAGDTVVTFERPMSAGLLRTFCYADGKWLERGEVITPEIERIGLAAIAPGCNDLLFVDANTVCFVGGLWQIGQTPGGKRSTIADELLLSKTAFRLGDGEPQAVGYLFKVNLSTRLTTPVIKLSIPSTPEGGSEGVGLLATSFDGRYLYIKGERSIGRLSIKALLNL